MRLRFGAEVRLRYPLRFSEGCASGEQVDEEFFDGE